jgi:hypothetical protein
MADTTSNYDTIIPARVLAVRPKMRDTEAQGLLPHKDNDAWVLDLLLQANDKSFVKLTKWHNGATRPALQAEDKVELGVTKGTDGVTRYDFLIV